MRTGKILTFAAIMLAAVVSGCSNGNKQDMHTDTSEVVFFPDRVAYMMKNLNLN